MVIVLSEDGTGYVGDSDCFRKLPGINMLEIPIMVVQAEFANIEELVTNGMNLRNLRRLE